MFLFKSHDRDEGIGLHTKFDYPKKGIRHTTDLLEPPTKSVISDPAVPLKNCELQLVTNDKVVTKTDIQPLTQSQRGEFSKADDSNFSILFAIEIKPNKKSTLITLLDRSACSVEEELS